MNKLRLGIMVSVLVVLAAGLGFALRYLLVRRAPPVSTATQLAQPPAPTGPVDFTLTGLHGHKHKLSEWRGRIVMLNFWATWCPPCRREIPMLMRLQAKYGQEKLRVVGIATDEVNPATVRAFVKKMDINYPVLWGHERAGDIAWKMGARLVGLPYTIVIGRRGKVLERHAGELDHALVRKLLQNKLARAE